jgi:hypothetical protein
LRWALLRYKNSGFGTSSKGLTLNLKNSVYMGGVRLSVVSCQLSVVSDP